MRARCVLADSQEGRRPVAISTKASGGHVLGVTDSRLYQSTGRATYRQGGRCNRVKNGARVVTDDQRAAGHHSVSPERDGNMAEPKRRHNTNCTEEHRTVEAVQHTGELPVLGPEAHLGAERRGTVSKRRR